MRVDFDRSACLPGRPKTTTDRIKNVKRTFDRIAPHFARTRAKAWEPVRDFIEESSGTIGIDIGCGNGRHAELLSKRTDYVIGIDISKEALYQAHDRAVANGFPLELIQADSSLLPLNARTADIAVYIATIHHLPSRDQRVQSLNELEAVLSRNGRALVSAWSVSHDRFSSHSGFDTKIDWTLPSGETVGRFYHIYDINEYKDDLDTSRLHVIDVFEEGGNCYAIVGPSKQ